MFDSLLYNVCSGFVPWVQSPSPLELEKNPGLSVLTEDSNRMKESLNKYPIISLYSFHWQNTFAWKRECKRTFEFCVFSTLILNMLHSNHIKLKFTFHLLKVNKINTHDILKSTDPPPPEICDPQSFLKEKTI